MNRSVATRPLGRDDLTIREVDGEFLLYDPVKDTVVLINHSAAVIFDLCDGTRTESEISAEIQRLYDLRAKQADKELRTTLDEFTQNNLMAPTRVRPEPALDE